MNFIEFRYLNDILSSSYKYNIYDNYVAIQISICKIYAIFFINPKYRRYIIQKFLEQPIYIGELDKYIKEYSNIINIDPNFKMLINDIKYSKDIISYGKIYPQYEKSYYTNTNNKLLIISFI